MTASTRPDPDVTLPNVLVPLDGSAQASVALPVAQGLARSTGALLHLIYIAEPLLPPPDLLRRLGLTPDQVYGSVLDQVGGHPAAGIVRLARERRSQYIVMCTHTAMDKGPGQLGSVAEEVLRTAPCPLVLVQPERGIRPWALRAALLPHDGTPTTAAALHPALDLVERAGAALAVQHVTVERERHPLEPGTLTVPHYMDQPYHEWAAWQQEFLQRVRALGHAPANLKCELHVAGGEPGVEIIRFAATHGTDLIILAWRGALEGAHAATLKAVIHDATCPVLVLRTQPADTSARGGR